MMYVQIPIFSGYANIAICPANGTVCYMIDDVQKNQNLYSEMNPKSKTFLPFYENHHYVLYPTTDDKVDDGILYFHSEELMKEYILEHLGTKYVTGRSLSVRVSTVAAPDFTTAKAEGSEHCQGNSYSNVCKKNLENEKKITKNKTTKKIQNRKTNKKIFEYTIIPVEEHCYKMEKLENEKKKNFKNKNTKKLQNEKNTKNISVSSTIPCTNSTELSMEKSWNTVPNKTSKKIRTTKKIIKTENRLEQNKFYQLSQNQEKQNSSKIHKNKNTERRENGQVVHEEHQQKHKRKSSNKIPGFIILSI